MKQSAPDPPAKSRHRGIDSLQYFILATFFIYALTRAILSTTDIDIAEGLHIGLCLGGALLFYLILLNRLTIFITIGICAVGTAAVFFGLRRTAETAAALEQAAAFLDNAVLLLRGTVSYQNEMDVPLTICIVFPFALCAGLFLRVTDSNIGLILAALITLTVMELSGYSPDWLSKALICLLIVILLVRKLNGNARGRRAAGTNAAFSLLSIPLCAAVLAAAWLLPKPADAGLNTEAVVAAGYSNSDVVTLGGSMRLQGTPVMTVQAGERVRLKGMARDHYTGTSWSATQSDETRLFQNSDGSYTLLSPAGDVAEDAIAAIIITPAAAATEVFAPCWAVGLSFSEGVSVLTDDTGVLRARSAFSGSYAVRYIQWDPAYLAEEPEGTTQEELSPYLTLPNTLPVRVSELAREVTRDAETPYEKASALLENLQGYSYTLDTGRLPAGADFVDNFLFEQQEGYCTSFASAMAVMARAVGIPSRYVTGYTLPAESEDGVYTVTSDQAHAWVEIYISGVGWVEFDPTPAGYDVTPTEDSQEALAPAETEPEEQESAAVSEAPSADADSGDTDGVEQDVSLSGALITVLIVLAAVTSLIGLVFLIRYLHRRGRQTNSQVVADTFKRLLRACDKAGYALRPGETAEAFARRLRDVPGMPDLGPAAAVFSKASYSRDPISPEERAVVAEALDAFYRREKVPLEVKC